jgi:hypothetical protein
VWRQDQVPELISDKDTPSWYDPYPVVFLSDIDRWSEVAQWAYPLYRPVVDTAALQAVVASILEGASIPEQRVLAA